MRILNKMPETRGEAREEAEPENIYSGNMQIGSRPENEAGKHLQTTDRYIW
jgi:hypothetical protein